MSDKKLVPISDHLADDLKKVYEIVDGQGFPMKSTGSTFKMPGQPKIDVSKLAESDIVRHMTNGHPRFQLRETAEKFQAAARAKIQTKTAVVAPAAKAK